MTDVDERTRKRADELWQAAGRPAGGSGNYLDRARELIAIEDNPDLATSPVPRDRNTGPDHPPAMPAETRGPSGEPVEPLQQAIANAGEFPTLTDQGEEETAPRPRKRSR